MFNMVSFVYSGRNIGYMIPEAFATTAVNMACAYIAASIPYANAAFTLQFYYVVIMGGYYISDQFLFVRHPTTRTFWQWLSWVLFFGFGEKYIRWLTNPNRLQLGPNVLCPGHARGDGRPTPHLRQQRRAFPL